MSRNKFSFEKEIIFICINLTVPIGNHVHKPAILVCDFTQITDTVRAALEGRQLQPVSAV